MHIHISENQVLQGPGDLGDEDYIRVLWAPPQPALEVALISLQEGSLPYWVNYVNLLQQIENDQLSLSVTDPSSSVLVQDSMLSKAQRDARDRRYDIIEPLVRDPERRVLQTEGRGRLITDRARETNVSVKYLYVYLRLWWQLGQLPAALAPRLHFRGGRGKARAPGPAKRGRPRYLSGAETPEMPVGINVDDVIATKLQSGVRFLKQGMSAPRAYREVLLLHFSDQVILDGLRTNLIRPSEGLPTFDQFRYWSQKVLRKGDVRSAVSGETKFARKNRARVGTARDLASGPGATYQIDATVADIYLRSRRDPSRLIGRPVLYIVVDHFSRMIVGFSVGLSGPSWEVGKMALENAFTDKVEFCARHDISIKREDWPSRHLCRQLTGDRGWDQLGKNAAEAAKGLDYSLATMPPYRPDLKGLVESRFQLLNVSDMKWVAGASHSRERGEPRHKLDAEYTLEDFTKMMILCIIRYNKSFCVNDPPSVYENSGARSPTPLDLWNYGFAACGAPQIADVDRVRSNLLHVGQARETDKGLRFKGLFYVPADPAKMEWFQRIPGRKWRQHEIRYDIRDAASILLPMRTGTTFEKCRLIESNRQYAGWTFDEVADHHALKRVEIRAVEDERLEVHARHQAGMADLEQSAKSLNKGVPLVTRRASGDRELRAVELREIRRAEAWTSDSQEPSPVEPIKDSLAVPLPVKSATANEAQPPLPPARSAPVTASYVELLRARRVAAQP